MWCNNVCLCARCLSLPLSRQTDDQQVVAFLPVAHMDQMFPEQERGTMEKRKASSRKVTEKSGVNINTR